MERSRWDSLNCFSVLLVGEASTGMLVTNEGCGGEDGEMSFDCSLNERIHAWLVATALDSLSDRRDFLMFTCIQERDSFGLSPHRLIGLMMTQGHQRSSRAFRHPRWYHTIILAAWKRVQSRFMVSHVGGEEPRYSERSSNDPQHKERWIAQRRSTG